MIRAYTAMLPRLQAEERMAEHNLLLAAAGHTMHAAARSKYLAGLQQRAAGRDRRRAARPTPAALAAMGIGRVSQAPSEASENVLEEQGGDDG